MNEKVLLAYNTFADSEAIVWLHCKSPRAKFLQASSFHGIVSDVSHLTFLIVHRGVIGIKVNNLVAIVGARTGLLALIYDIFFSPGLATVLNPDYTMMGEDDTRQKDVYLSRSSLGRF